MFSSLLAGMHRGKPRLRLLQTVKLSTIPDVETSLLAFSRPIVVHALFIEGAM
jgi:hypothetical protein